jgi:hypothetical protein
VAVEVKRLVFPGEMEAAEELEGTEVELEIENVTSV